jgi:hypothetical protein
MQTRWLIREGNLDASPAHRQARSFDELAF